MLRLYLIILSLVVLRFINILNIPPFGDEALYLSLADQITIRPESFLDSIRFGVFPVFIWMQSVVMFLIGDVFNPLLSGRLLSIIFDLFSALLVFYISKELFGKFTGLLSVIIYLSLPLTFFHSRFFLLDSPTNFFSLLAVLLAIRLTNKKHGKNTVKVVFIITSIVIAFFIKPLAVVILPAILLSPVSFINFKKKYLTQSIFSFLKITVVLAITLAIILIFYLPVSDEFSKRYITETKTFSSQIQHLKTNLWKAYWWLKVYATLPALFLSCIVLISGIVIRSRKIIWVCVWLVSIMFLEASLSANFYPRHLLVLAAPISILTAILITKLYSFNNIIFTLISIILFINLWQNLIKIVIKPENAPIALEDRQQFFEDWTAGVGNSQVAKQLENFSEKNQITVYTENAPNQYWLFTNLYKIKNVTFYPSNELVEGRFINERCTRQETYIILNRQPNAPISWPVKLVFSYPKGPSRSINLYKVTCI